MQLFLIIILSLIGLITIARPLTTLFHELGHAIPAMLLTKEKVTVYIGSYGNFKNSLHINAGRLVIYIRFNPFEWRHGLCVPSASTISINRQIIYLVSGPVTSLLVASIACYFTFAYDLHGFLKVFLLVFLASSIFDLFVNLIPKENPLRLNDGTYTYNDGYHIKQLLYHKRLPQQYGDAVLMYRENHFAEAAAMFSRVLSMGYRNPEIYRLAINAYLLAENSHQAKELADELRQLGKLNEHDIIHFDLLKQHSIAATI